MIKPNGIITFTTDFGASDWFVGTMKGVALAINPKATLVDVTHEIPPGDIQAGAFALLASCRYFPAGAVHVGVVDPGVGSQRRAVVVETPNYYFVGPDNGLLALALSQEKIRRIHALENREHFLEPVSHTFHGRDIFAPVAAHVSRGLKLEKLGGLVEKLETLPWPAPENTPTGTTGEVVYIDRFGNLITNLRGSLFESMPKGAFVLMKGKRLPLGAHYGAVAPGRPIAVPGSSGFLEIAVNGGNAARSLAARVGDQVKVRLR